MGLLEQTKHNSNPAQLWSVGSVSFRPKPTGSFECELQDQWCICSELDSLWQTPHTVLGNTLPNAMKLLIKTRAPDKLHLWFSLASIHLQHHSLHLHPYHERFYIWYTGGGETNTWNILFTWLEDPESIERWLHDGWATLCLPSPFFESRHRITKGSP